MDNFNKGPKLDADIQDTKEQIHDTYQEIKDKAEGFYNESMKTVCEARDHVKEYSEDLLNQVKDKPLTSLLIAGGIGFILAALLKK